MNDAFPIFEYLCGVEKHFTRTSSLIPSTSIPTALKANNTTLYAKVSYDQQTLTIFSLLDVNIVLMIYNAQNNSSWIKKKVWTWRQRYVKEGRGQKKFTKKQHIYLLKG